MEVKTNSAALSRLLGVEMTLLDSAARLRTLTHLVEDSLHGFLHSHRSRREVLALLYIALPEEVEALERRAMSVRDVSEYLRCFSGEVFRPGQRRV